VLNGSLPVHVEEQLVLDDRATKVAAILAALEGRRESHRCGQRRRKITVAELTEGTAVEGVAA